MTYGPLVLTQGTHCCCFRRPGAGALRKSTDRDQSIEGSNRHVRRDVHLQNCSLNDTGTCSSTAARPRLAAFQVLFTGLRHHRSSFCTISCDGLWHTTCEGLFQTLRQSTPAERQEHICLGPAISTYRTSDC